MNVKHNTARQLRRVLAATVLLAILLCLIPKGTARDAGTQYIVKYKASAGAPFDVVDGTELQRLLSRDALEWYEPDGEAVLLDAAPYYEEAQWNLDMIGAEAVFRHGWTGGGVRVGVLDSGVNPHPDLQDCLRAGYNYITGAPDPTDTSDSFGHGTRVAGLVAGAGDSGCIGVAPGAEIVPLKITDGKSVKISAVCRAIYGGIDDFGCTVLNLSLGVQTEYAALREAVEYAEARGVTVVSAAGNGGTSALYYPAAYETVIGVGAVNQDGTIYSRSNHNGSVFLAAPGVAVRSTANHGGYAGSTGTSFSVPQVSGAAAVLQGMRPGISPAALRSLLAATARDAGAEGYDVYYGHGILDLAAAADTLSADEPHPDPFSFSPEAGPARTLHNWTDAPVNCTYSLAYYSEDGVCRSVYTERFTVPAGESVELPQPEAGRSFGQFVYETDTMVPLTEARRSGAQKNPSG